MSKFVIVHAYDGAHLVRYHAYIAREGGDDPTCWSDGPNLKSAKKFATRTAAEKICVGGICGFQAARIVEVN